MIAGGDAQPVDVLIQRLDPALPLPAYAHPGDAGADLVTAVDVELAPGDALLLYTDGLTEARVDGSRDRYDEDGLLAFARALAPTTARDAVDATFSLLEGFGDGLDDDTAVLALGVRR